MFDRFTCSIITFVQSFATLIRDRRYNPNTLYVQYV